MLAPNGQSSAERLKRPWNASTGTHLAYARSVTVRSPPGIIVTQKYAQEDDAQMGETERKTSRIYQGVSGWDKPRTRPGMRHCMECGLWFCNPHFSDADWHLCVAQ